MAHDEPTPRIPTGSLSLTRRRFLAGSTLAGVGVTLPPPAGDDGGAAAPRHPGARHLSATPQEQPDHRQGGPTRLRRRLKVVLANHTGFYAMVTPEWEQRTGVTVEFTREAFGPLPLKLTPAFESGGESWDVVYLWRAWVDLYEKYLTPLDELGVTVDDSDMLPAAIEASMSTSGKWFGLSSNIYTYVLYCNKKMFADAGVAIPTTYEQFVAAAKQFTTGDQYGYVDGCGTPLSVPQVVRLVPPQRR